VLTLDQRAEFERTGILKLEGVFSSADAARMRDVIWDQLQRKYQIDRDDPTTWHRHPPSGLSKSRKHRAFAPIFGPMLADVMDDLLGPGQWVMPKHYGQALVTMPSATHWRVPHKLWHSDFLYDARADELFALKYWALLGDVRPAGGGTPQLAGSHRLTARYIEGRTPEQLEYKRVRDGFLRSHPWLRALSTNDDDPDRNARFMRQDVDVHGLPARVVECTGNAGDVYVTHPWVMHSIATNSAREPRIMRSMAVYSAAYAARNASSTGAQRSGSLL
jgi:hypothetical protein